MNAAWYQIHCRTRRHVGWLWYCSSTRRATCRLSGHGSSSRWAKGFHESSITHCSNRQSPATSNRRYGIRALAPISRDSPLQ